MIESVLPCVLWAGGVLCTGGLVTSTSSGTGTEIDVGDGEKGWGITWGLLKWDGGSLDESCLANPRPHDLINARVMTVTGNKRIVEERTSSAAKNQ